MGMIEEDEMERTIPDRVLLSRLIPYVMTYKRRFILSVVLVILATAVGLIMPFLLKIAIDDYITPFTDGVLTASQAMAGVVWVALAYLVLGVSSYGINALRDYVLHWIGLSVMRDLRNEMFRHLQKMSKSFFDKSETGVTMSKITSDVETMSEVLATGLVEVFSDVLLLVAILILMFLVSVELTLYALLMVPVILGIALVFRGFARRAYRRTRKKIAGIMANLQESISGIRVAQSFSREQQNAQRFDQVNVENMQANVYAAQVFAAFFPMIEVIGALALSIVLFFGGRAVIGERVTFGTLVLFQAYIIRFFQPILAMTTLYNSIQSAFAASERIFGLLDTPPDVLETEGARGLADVQGRIEFEDVTFGYVENAKVLENFSLTVAPGERLAIVGPTGAGKSTITNLLLRMYDVQSGRILLDGQDIRDLSLDSLRRTMAIVLQDTFLFSGTIADNIRYGRPDAPDEEVRKVAKMVGADEFISRLPAGYATLVTERGGNLSVGQRQLVAFARALLVDPPILLLDEATSSVDPYTELVIQTALEKLLEERTSIVIAHRLSTVRNSDRIVVIDRGRIVEQGRHQELLDQGGMYRDLCQMQFMGAAAQ